METKLINPRLFLGSIMDLCDFVIVGRRHNIGFHVKACSDLIYLGEYPTDRVSVVRIVRTPFQINGA
jgi:hypothetical protein